MPLPFTIRQEGNETYVTYRELTIPVRLRFAVMNMGIDVEMNGTPLCYFDLASLRPTNIPPEGADRQLELVIDNMDPHRDALSPTGIVHYTRSGTQIAHAYGVEQLLGLDRRGQTIYGHLTPT